MKRIIYLILLSAVSLEAQPSSLPVYSVVQAGATFSQATNLAASLNIPWNQLVMGNGLVGFIDPTNWMRTPTLSGLVGFIDPTNWMRVPTLPCTNSALESNLLAVTINEYPSIPIKFEQVDFGTLTSQPVMDTNTAVELFSSALSGAQLIPELYNGFIYGIPQPYFTIFNASLTNSGQGISISQPLDTEVEYRMYDENGIPFIGPGMQAQVAFDGNGNVTRLLYAARQLTSGPMVQIIPESTASNSVAGLFPSNALISLQLVYWCPPFTPTWMDTCPCDVCPCLVWNPGYIIPWYACSGTSYMTNPVTGLVSTVNSKIQMIPATADTNFVPVLNLTAQTNGSGQVVASVSVTGGAQPYTYVWSGSDSSVFSNYLGALTYTPITRLAQPSLQINPVTQNSFIVSWDPHWYRGQGVSNSPAPPWVLQSATDLAQGSNGWTTVTNLVQTNNGIRSVTVEADSSARFFRLGLASSTIPATEVVAVNVTDANGVSIQASQSVSVLAQIILPALSPSVISYGCESPREPIFAVARIGWQQGMSTPGAGGGAQSFCWMGDQAWPGDFVEPDPAGAAVATPWVYGDADYANWGVNTACIVLNIADGSYDNFDSSEPGAWYPVWYPTAQLYEPGDVSVLGTVCTGLVQGEFTTNTHWYAVNYNGSWGSIGPNDSLFWLCMDCCDVLDEHAPYGGDATNRWGPAFGSLHLMTGWNSEAWLGDGSFEKDFAQNMLGVHAAPQTVLQAWFNAAHAHGTGVPAAMGPFGPGMLSDYDDYYWGKGNGVNSTFVQKQIIGWWYVTTTLPATPP